MSRPTRPTEVILVASESATTAALVQKLLKEEFENVHTSNDPNMAAVDFDQHHPSVLVLAFDSIEKSERHNLGLYRQSKEISQQPHRTLILCNKVEAQRAYELCRAEIFDDYALFWPMAHDASRLPMAVHHALRELAGIKDGRPRPAEFVAQLRPLADLELLMRARMAQSDGLIDSTGRAIAQAEQEITLALANFSRSLAQGDLAGLVDARHAKALQQALDRLTHESIEVPLHAAADKVQPLRDWSDEFRQESAPHLESIRSITTMVDSVQATVMIVDDDEFQHKIVSRLLKDGGYRLVFASSGIEALNMLRKVQPDLILMDLSMPSMDGLEVTRRLKGVARFAHIPIIMITGNSEENIVTDSLKAGAIDFMVKPLFQETLILKITKVLGLGTTRSLSGESLPDLSQSDL